MFFICFRVIILSYKLKIPAVVFRKVFEVVFFQVVVVFLFSRLVFGTDNIQLSPRLPFFTAAQK